MGRRCTDGVLYVVHINQPGPEVWHPRQKMCQLPRPLEGRSLSLFVAEIADKLEGARAHPSLTLRFRSSTDAAKIA